MSQEQPRRPEQQQQQQEDQLGANQGQPVTDIAAREGFAVTQTEVPGGRIVTEQVGGQVVGQYVIPGGTRACSVEQSSITLGQALEAVGQSAGDKPVGRGDAAAIQAAEYIVTGSNIAIPGGVAAAAQSAAAYNEETLRDKDKIKLSQVLSGARRKLPGDKVVNREDALRIENAERWNNPVMETQPGGVGASMVSAARVNESMRT